MNPAEPSSDPAAVVARTLGATLAMIGIVGLLRAGLTGFDREHTVLVFTLAPTSSVIHLLVGLVGVGMGTTPGRGRRFLGAAGVLFLVWGLVSAPLAGSPEALFTDDLATIVLYLALGVAALAIVLVPRLTARRDAASRSADAGA